MKKTHLTLLLLMLIVFAGCKTESALGQLSEPVQTQMTSDSVETTSFHADETETAASPQITSDISKTSDNTETVAESVNETEKTEIVLENIGTFYGELPLPKDFAAVPGSHLLHYDNFSYLKTLYSDFITSESVPERFDDEFSYIYYQEELGRHGREITPEDTKKVSVGDQIGGLIVDKASIDFYFELYSYGGYLNYPKSAYLELSGSTKLRGIVIENNDSKFYVYRDSIEESGFPFINLGETGFSAAFDSIGLHNSYCTLCFLLSDDTMDQLEFNDKGYCEVEIIFTNIKQSWNKNGKNSAFCLCIAEFESISKQ